MNVDETRVEAELARIRGRLVGPAPQEHAALYAAQQALSWALEPNGFRSPYDMITGRREGSGGCSAESRLPPS
jgi:hypothetical protein